MEQIFFNSWSTWSEASCWNYHSYFSAIFLRMGNKVKPSQCWSHQGYFLQVNPSAVCWAEQSTACAPQNSKMRWNTRVWVKAFNLGSTSFTEGGTEEELPTPLPNRASTEGLRFLYDLLWAQFAFCDRKADFHLLSKHLWSKAASPCLPAPGAARMAAGDPQHLAPSHTSGEPWGPWDEASPPQGHPQGSDRCSARTPPQDPQLPWRGWPAAPRSHSNGAAGRNGASELRGASELPASPRTWGREAPHCGSSAFPQPAVAPSPLPALLHPTQSRSHLLPPSLPPPTSAAALEDARAAGALTSAAPAPTAARGLRHAG